MKSDFFIDRPVFSTVLSVVIVIVGLLGLVMLPVDQYPRIVPPVVKISASYPGASAETIQKSVIVPLEQAINGVEDMTYMTSSAAVGSASVTIYFRQGTNADMAAVNVQNKVSRATGQLPPEVTQIGVTTMKRQTSMVKIFSLYSPDDSYDETFLSNYLKINVEPRIQRIRGVGEVHPRRRILDARLAEARRNGPVQAHPVGRDGGAGRAEHRIGDRYAGRELPEHVPVHDEIPRTPPDARRVR